jgi:hypothetical protein
MFVSKLSGIQIVFNELFEIFFLQLFHKISIYCLCLIKSSFDLNEGYDDLDDENSKVIINLNFNRIISAELTHKNTL